jgi:hypothetical protein
VGNEPAVVPVPLALIACGLPTPLLMTVMVALRAPATDGLNVTPREQVAPGLTDAHVLDAMVNSAGLLLAVLETTTAVLPMLVIVTLLAALVVATVWLAKLSVVAIDSWPCDAPAVPVPLVLIVCGLPTPLLVTVIVAARGPATDGLNVTPTEQLAPALTVVQELVAMVNSAGVLLTTLDMETAVPPTFVMVTDVGGLVVDTVWLAKLIEPGIDNWPGVATALPVPLTPTVNAPPLRETVMLALRNPAAVGWNATLKLQLAPAASGTLVQVLDVSGKCVESGVLAVTADAAPLPALVIVTVVVALVAPTVTEPNATGAGDA